MFQDCSLGQVSIASTWRKSRDTTVSEIQTDPVSFAAADAQTAVSLFQTTATVENSAQTSAIPPGLELAHKQGDVWIYGSEEPKSPKAPGDEIEESLLDPNLLAFLETVGPPMLQQLDLNLRSSAFNGYDVCWEEESTQIRCLHTLVSPKATEAELQVTDISWNATGSVVAASYGRIDVVGWCYGKGFVSTWNVLREVSANKPDLTLDTDSYLTSIAFHPEEPSVLAGGTYNGEILIWNTAAETDNLMYQSETNVGTGAILHNDPVYQIKWVANKRESKLRYVILTISGDGKILIWTLNNELKQCIAGYEISNKRGGVEGVTCVGILQNALAQSLSNKLPPPSLDGTVLIGTEAGRVYRTNIKPVTLLEGAAAKTAETKVTLNDPVVFRYEGHQGPVQSLDCSPFHRNLFLTCSSDGSVKLFSVHEAGKLHVVLPANSIDSYLYGAQWSPVRPFVFACASKDANVYFYDLEESHIRPAAVVPCGTDSKPVLCFQFNAINREFMATGDAKGMLRVWRLSDRLCTRTGHEATLLGTRDVDLRKELWFKYAGLTF